MTRPSGPSRLSLELPAPSVDTHGESAWQIRLKRFFAHAGDRERPGGMLSACRKGTRGFFRDFIVPYPPDSRNPMANISSRGMSVCAGNVFDGTRRGRGNQKRRKAPPLCLGAAFCRCGAVRYHYSGYASLYRNVEVFCRVFPATRINQTSPPT